MIVDKRYWDQKLVYNQDKYLNILQTQVQKFDKKLFRDFFIYDKKLLLVISRFGACCRVFGGITKALDFKAFRISLLAFSQLLTLSNSEFIKYSKLVIVCAFTQMHVSSANKQELVRILFSKSFI